MAKTALLIGATGLVGEQCLTALLQSNAYEKVIALTRSKLTTSDPKLENIVTYFEHLENLKDKMNADDVFCSLGTTISKAGSEEAFRRVDFEIPLQVAGWCAKNGAKQFILVSSLGANEQSSIFYSRVKGELENALKTVGFKTLLIFRPSILLGNRKERRYGEEVGRFVAEKFPFLFAGPLKKYSGTPVDILAAKMIHFAQQNMTGVCVFENEEILK